MGHGRDLQSGSEGMSQGVQSADSSGLQLRAKVSRYCASLEDVEDEEGKQMQ